MEWKNILPYHQNPPIIKLMRHPIVQENYNNYKQTETQLKTKLFEGGKVWVFTKIIFHIIL